MSPFSRLLSLSHVSCLTTLVSCLTSRYCLTPPVFPVCFTSPVLCLLSIACLTYPVCLVSVKCLPDVYCLSHFSFLFHISCLSHIFCLPGISCLRFPSQEKWDWPATSYQWDAKLILQIWVSCLSALSGLSGLNTQVFTDMAFIWPRL